MSVPCCSLVLIVFAYDMLSNMAWSPNDSLVIGISSRALFRLDAEDKIYRDQGTESFIEYQRNHEEDLIEQGVAFPLLKALLGLNQATDSKPKIEIVIISRNHPECLIRINNSLKHHGLPILRAVFTGNGDPLPYLQAFKVGLFLSGNEGDVTNALRAGISAGLIHGGPDTVGNLDGTPIIAFDGDAVLFSDESDKEFVKGEMPGFTAYERANIDVPLAPGPLGNFAVALESLRDSYPIDSPPFRIALVTARNLEFGRRPIKTLRIRGIRLDQAAFCGNMSKAVILGALKPLIFFDDSTRHCDDALSITPTIRIPKLEEEPAPAPSPIDDQRSRRPDRFLSVCRIFLRNNYPEHEPALLEWQQEHLLDFTDEAFDRFTDEFERSSKGTPAGKQRRAAGAKNEDLTKLLMFLGNLKRKYLA